MKLFTEELQIATKKTIEMPWCGGKKGKYFKCAFCGHKFKVNDKYRVVYTNDIKGGGGNPIICEKCNNTTDKIRSEWKNRCDEYRSEKFWWFRKSRD